jgi:hypothetical protein
MFKVVDNNGFKDLTYQGDIIKKDNLIFKLKGLIKNTPTRTSIQIGKNIHIEDNIGAFMNHSCNPSCYIKDSSVYANKDIQNGESLTFDYNLNETSMSHPFICNCCGKLIKGNCE